MQLIIKTKRTILALWVLAAVTVVQAGTIKLTVNDTRKQTITGFGAACCDGAMCPYGTDTNPVKLLYGQESKIGLNIMRMEISPSFQGDENASWSNYNWQGCVPSAKIVKQRGGIVFGTPWSPPGEYKTNGMAQGGNSESQGNNRGALREDCYEKFFLWLNSYLNYMKSKGVNVDAVSIQNEPDFWVSYSGCLYTPEQQLSLVKNYAHLLDRETYQGVRLISAEPYAFDPVYSDKLLNDPIAREQIDIVAGHLYGSSPLGNMKSASTFAKQYGKELWMTEHSVTDNIDHLPTWHENLIFAEELNESMLADCTGYIYWYMRAHWAFVGTGEAKYNVGTMKNTKNTLLPRAYVMSHFAKHVTGSTRLTTSRDKTDGEGAGFEYSAYIKGDSLIVMAIDTTKTGADLNITLPYNVKSGTHLCSTGNEKENLCQETPITIEESTKVVTVNFPARSLNTYIFQIDNGNSQIISFEDANVKALCVANWDTNGDGELSEAEAAAVTDLGEVFKNNAKITTFDELRFFTHLTSIGDYAFTDCYCLTSITIPNSVTSIRDYAFSYCSGLTSITIPNGVTSIGNSAFKGCSGLTSITIPNSVTSIGSGAFSDCSALTSITIPNSVKSIGSGAFSYCSGLTSITVSSGNTKYDSRNNCNAIIEKSTNTLIVGCKNTVILNSVTSIGFAAFHGCSGLTSITIPNSVTSIGFSAFDGCSGLTSITIPNSVTSIGDYAFRDCNGLKDIISEIKKPFEINENVFSVYSTAKLTVPAGTKSAYQSTNYWNKFKSIVEYGAPTTYSLSITTSTGGRVTYAGNTINGTTKSFNVDEGTSAIFTFIPDDGYRLSSVKVNNTDVTASVTNNQYTISNISQNTTVEVLFSSITSVNPTIAYNADKMILSSNGDNAFYWKETWANMEYDIHHMLGISQAEFEANYTMDSYNNCFTQYYYDGTIKPCTCYESNHKHANDTLGVIKYLPNYADEQTSVIEWNVTTEQLKKYIDNLGGNKPNLPRYIQFRKTGNINGPYYVYVCINSSGLEVVNYTLTITSSGGGHISYENNTIKGGTQNYTVVAGSSATLSFTPDDNCILRNVIVNGIDVTSSVMNNQYTISNISQNTTVGAVFASISKYPIAEAVDLDLPSGIKWASWNMGSSSPLDIPSDGKGLFSWGDAEGDARSLSIDDNPYFKGCGYDDKSVNIAGSKYDIATVQWGKGWQLPTIEQFRELVTYCNMQIADFTDDMGKTYRAYKISSKTNPSKFIYLPEAGLRNSKGEYKQVQNGCYYWTAINMGAGSAVYAMPFPGSVNDDYVMYTCLLAIRPIFDENATGDGTGEPVALEKTYTLSITCSGGGYVSYLGNNQYASTQTYTVKEGESATLTFLPNNNFRLNKLVVNGTDVTSNVTNNQYTISNITQNTTVSVVFGVIHTYSLSLTSTGNGTVTLNGTDVRNTTKTFTFTEGSSATLMISTSNGSVLKSLTVNNDDVTSKVLNDSYTISNITQNIKVNVVFEENSPIITFADSNVKALCITNWDTNGDGELSEAEAAAVTDLGGVFKNNTKITSFDELRYFTNLTSIGDYVFYNCSGLTSISIPNSVTSIGDYAFYNCSGLTLISIPNSVTSIGVGTFENCINLTTINIPNSVTSIGDYAFFYCSGLTSITIPNSVTTIGNMALNGCSGLISIEIPNSVTSIGYGVFYNCSGLTSITIPNSVSSIDDFLFYCCKGLTSITIPNSVTSIGESAFRGCSGLTSITIPNSVISIGDYAFYECNGLKDIISEIKKPFVINENVFSVYSTAKLTVPAGTKSAYQSTAGWDKFSNIVEYGAPTTYSLSVIVSSGGSVTYLGNTISGATKSFNVDEGTSVTLTFTPDNGYRLGSVKVNGTDVTSKVTDNACTISNINQNTTVEVNFEEIPPTTYLLTITSKGNGYVVYDGTIVRNKTSVFTVIEGDSATPTLTFTPDDGNQVKSIVVNDVDVTANVYKNQYTISNTSQNTTVEVEFEEIPPTTYSLTITAKGNGYASFDGTEVRNKTNDFTVVEGTSATITFVADDGYRIKSVKVNGADVTSNLTNNQYTISNINGDTTVEVEFVEKLKKMTVDGVNYKVASYDDQTVKVETGSYSRVLTVPASFDYEEKAWTVIGIEENALANSSELAAIMWKPNYAMTATVNNPNLLLYVESATYAPSSVKNVVVNGLASSITLTEAAGDNDFYCPESFTAKTISYKHNYTMTTGVDDCQGWESIALPFDVQTITHAEKGTIVPFATWHSGDSYRPFWLYEMTSNGWKAAQAIRSNTPYIISMPYNSLYYSEACLNGIVTFSAENVTVDKTEANTVYYNGKRFVPIFMNQSANGEIYALNVSNDWESNNTYMKPGSEFVRNMRSVHPFEAYMTTTNDSRMSYGVFEDMPTEIHGVIDQLRNAGMVNVYNLNGQKIKAEDGAATVEDVKRSLSPGVYIIDGRKTIIKK